MTNVWWPSATRSWQPFRGPHRGLGACGRADNRYGRRSAEGAVRRSPFPGAGRPPGYVVHDELAALVDAATAVDTGAVGLLGQGGIGKSVLAAALGRDERIRHRFPDGIFWITVGERADVLAVQLDLLARLGATGTAPRTIGDAITRLQEVLAERRVLLLVDDVWSDVAAQAFRVAGPQGPVWNAGTGRQVAAVHLGSGRPVSSLAFAPSGTRLAVTRGSGSMVIWDLATGVRTELGARVDEATAVTWSPDGTFVATTGSSGAVIVQRIEGTFRTRIQLAGANCVTRVGPTVVVGQRNGPAVLEMRDRGAD